MAPKCLPLELLFEIVPFIPAENATPNALSSSRLLYNFLLPRVIKWKEMTDLKEFRSDILEVFKNFREEFHQKMDNFREEFNQKLDNFRDEFNQKMDNFRDEFNQKLEKVHDESNQKFDSLNKRVDLLSQVVNNVAIDVAILKTNAPRTMAKRQSNSSLTVLEKVNDVIKAETMTGTILALGRHLVQFGKVSKSVFDTFDTLTESTDEEFSKQIKMMRKLCSDLVEGWTRLKVNVAKDASVKQAFCFFAGRLKKLELHAVAELEKLAMELNDESKSAAESLRESFFVLSTAFNNALAKFAVPSREMSPVLSGDISRLTIRPIKISAHAITVKWYAISRGCMENIPIHKYLLFYTLATDDYNWKKKKFYHGDSFRPSTPAYVFEIGPLLPATFYKFSVCAIGYERTTLIKSREIKARTLEA